MKSHLIWVLECPPIYTIVGGVQPAVREPDDISRLEASRPHSMEWSVPMQGLPGHLITINGSAISVECASYPGRWRQ